MKVGAKRRRTKQEIQEEKLEAAERARDVEEKLEKYEVMEKQIRLQGEPKYSVQYIDTMLKTLVDNGLLRTNG